ncbi:hypothetical protein [uncultured Kingella sp.]|uniref:hypothetical protein n=1 Tax=uncultured Kingella sp. TaxID=159270 RepID=UPI00259651FA|nr:hypothetical protein [uncultured Kingella sp.]
MIKCRLIFQAEIFSNPQIYPAIVIPAQAGIRGKSSNRLFLYKMTNIAQGSCLQEATHFAFRLPFNPTNRQAA